MWNTQPHKCCYVTHNKHRSFHIRFSCLCICFVCWKSWSSWSREENLFLSFGNQPTKKKNSERKEELLLVYIKIPWSKGERSVCNHFVKRAFVSYRSYYLISYNFFYLNLTYYFQIVFKVISTKKKILI